MLSAVILCTFQSILMLPTPRAVGCGAQKQHCRLEGFPASLRHFKVILCSLNETTFQHRGEVLGARIGERRENRSRLGASYSATPSRDMNVLDGVVTEAERTGFLVALPVHHGVH